mmetsp:Transcript_21953/g.68101  ORF Transcript_21953/g.68101 Transcript_21953/m.68101 type:complete len:202 (+) Transcript_21953:4432-5037(+)
MPATVTEPVALVADAEKAPPTDGAASYLDVDELTARYELVERPTVKKLVARIDASATPANWPIAPRTVAPYACSVCVGAAVLSLPHAVPLVVWHESSWLPKLIETVYVFMMSTCVFVPVASNVVVVGNDAAEPDGTTYTRMARPVEADAPMFVVPRASHEARLSAAGSGLHVAEYVKQLVMAYVGAVFDVVVVGAADAFTQ